jgi:hypothetical protein
MVQCQQGRRGVGPQVPVGPEHRRFHLDAHHARRGCGVARRLAECVGRFLHLLERAGFVVRAAFDGAREFPCTFGQLIHHGQRLALKRIHEKAGYRDREQQDECRAESARDTPRLQPVDRRVERVKQQEAENERQQHRLQVAQQDDGHRSHDHDARHAPGS